MQIEQTQRDKGYNQLNWQRKKIIGEDCVCAIGELSDEVEKHCRLNKRKWRTGRYGRRNIEAGISLD